MRKNSVQNDTIFTAIHHLTGTDHEDQNKIWSIVTIKIDICDILKQKLLLPELQGNDVLMRTVSSMLETENSYFVFVFLE